LGLVPFHQVETDIEENAMIPAKTRKLLTGAAATTVILAFGFAYAQQGPRGKSSYMQVEINEPFSAIFARLSGQKPEVSRGLERGLINTPPNSD
jgi:hypothetical protein